MSYREEEMEASFVSRARTAIHSAAVKAEKAFTDNIKRSDSALNQDFNDTQSRTSSSSPKYAPPADDSEPSPEGKKKGRRPKPIKTKQDWHERFRSLRIGKKEVEEEPERPENFTMAYANAIFDDNLYLMGEREFSQSKVSEQGGTVDNSQTLSTDIIPSSAIVKRLAVLVDAGVHYNSVKDLLASSRGSSPVRERASLSISAVKSLVLREKEDNLAREFGSDKKVLSIIHTLLNPEGHFTGRTLSGLEAQTNVTSLIKEIHGAPVESFIVKLSEAVGCLKTMRKMAAFWSRVVAELGRLWCEGQYIPGIPLDEIPDLNSCLLYQQYQVINCCISRKRRHKAAVESLEFVTSQASSNAEGSSANETTTPNPSFYARTMSGEVVLRLGADKICDNITMLETGEPVYSPIMQEPPLLTEDLIKETEEFVLRTGSVGAGCSQLLSDMQAFKAANPGCILEDFIRWHSPPDWTENDTTSDVNDTSDSGDVSLSKGQLSGRMQKAGNLWRELWEASKPVPAVRQAPLYDEDLAVEGILDSMEDVSPTELFKQLFVVALGAGLVIAESILSANPSLIKMFNDCKNYILGTCQGNISVDKLDDTCLTIPISLESPTSILEPKPSSNFTMDSSPLPSSPIPIFSNFTPKKTDDSSTTKPLNLWPGMYHSPVTIALWEMRSVIFERLLDPPLDAPPQSQLQTKTPSQARMTIRYEFSSDYTLREQYRDPWNEVRIGKLLEDLDALAGTISVKHCSDIDSTTRPLYLVTASVDKMVLKKPISVDRDLNVVGAVTWVGRSSIEIQLDVIQSANDTADDSVALTANFIFVARDYKTGQAALVNRLKPETEREKSLYEAAEARSILRKRKLKDNKKEIANGEVNRFEALLAEGRIFCDMPALADRDSILLRDTRLENSLICQPQQRNIHGRIFGGFLMHRAFELAFSTAYTFAGMMPSFMEVDHVDFLRPVDVGNFLRFKSCVLYTDSENSDQPLIHVEVIAHVTRPEDRSSEVSNKFYFIFTVRPEAKAMNNGHRIRKVVPATEEEAHRIVDRMDADSV